jgi:hypothetical protein
VSDEPPGRGTSMLSRASNLVYGRSLRGLAPKLRLRSRQQGARHPGHPGLAWPSVDHEHRRLYRASAEPVQGLLAGLGCRDFLDGFSDGAEAQSARMTFAAGSSLQDKLRHSRLADLVSVMRLERIPGAVALHEVHSKRVAK